MGRSVTRTGGVAIYGEYCISSGRISRIVPGLSSANMLDFGDSTSRCLLGLGFGLELGPGSVPVMAAYGCWTWVYGEYGWTFTGCRCFVTLSSPVVFVGLGADPSTCATRTLGRIGAFPGVRW